MDENPYKSPTAPWPKRTVLWIVIAIVVLVVALPIIAIIIVSGLNWSAKPEPFIFTIPPEN
jgi:hypothetical protein